MKKIAFYALEADQGKTLLRISQSNTGAWKMNGERFTTVEINAVSVLNSDVDKWIEIEIGSQEEYMLANGYAKIKEIEENE